MIPHLRHCTNLLIETKQIQIHKFVSLLPIMFLMRAWKDKASSLDVPWDNIQIVVPSVLRRSLLEFSHDIPATSHLAVTRTKKRLEAHFYSSSLTQNVKTTLGLQHLSMRRKGR